MKCLKEPENRKKVEVALHQLLSTVNTPIDESSLTIYIMEYLSQLPGIDENQKQSLEEDLNCFLLDDTNRIVNSLFTCLDTIENSPTEQENNEEENNRVAINEQPVSMDLKEETVEDEYNPTIVHEEKQQEESNSNVPLEPVISKIDDKKEKTVITKMGKKNYQNRQNRRNAIAIKAAEILKKMMSPNATPLEKAQLKFELLSKTNILFRSLKVNNIPSDKLSVMPLAMHFKHYGEIVNITVQESDKSAIIHFATSKAAYAAMRSRSAVFNNRFVIVEPYYDPEDPTTFDTAESLAAANEAIEAKKEDQEEKMKLVEEQHQLKNQEIENLEKSIQRRLALLSKYASFARTIKEEEKVQLKKSLDKVLIPLYEEAEALYDLYLKAGKISTRNEDPKNDSIEKIKNYLFAVTTAFENTYLYQTLKEDVTNQLMSIFNKQLTQVNTNYKSSTKSYSKHKNSAYKGKYYDKSLYQIDNRSKEIVIANLPEGCTENDIIYSLKGYFGVQNIRIEGTNGFVTFEQNWHTKKPIKTGLYIKNKIMYPQLVTRNE